MPVLPTSSLAGQEPRVRCRRRTPQGAGVFGLDQVAGPRSWPVAPPTLCLRPKQGLFKAEVRDGCLPREAADSQACFSI